jgi:hypothetical protein
MGALPQALEIMFAVQMKRSNNEETTRRKTSLPTYKACCFFFPLLFGPLLLFKSHNFLFI